jgi:peptidoglycan/LPS O-acetylase OafA/YrhL
MPTTVSFPQAPVLATALLGGVLLGLALDSSVIAYAVATGAGGAAAGVSAVRMATCDSFDSRLAAAVLSAVCGLIALVVMVAGVPGASTGDITVPGAALVVCGIGVPLLLYRRHRSGAPDDHTTRPYAP